MRDLSYHDRIKQDKLFPKKNRGQSIPIENHLDDLMARRGQWTLWDLSAQAQMSPRQLQKLRERTTLPPYSQMIALAWVLDCAWWELFTPMVGGRADDKN